MRLTVAWRFLLRIHALYSCYIFFILLFFLPVLLLFSAVLYLFYSPSSPCVYCCFFMLFIIIVVFLLFHSLFTSVSCLTSPFTACFLSRRQVRISFHFLQSQFSLIPHRFVSTYHRDPPLPPSLPPFPTLISVFRLPSHPPRHLPSPLLLLPLLVLSHVTSQREDNK